MAAAAAAAAGAGDGATVKANASFPVGNTRQAVDRRYRVVRDSFKVPFNYKYLPGPDGAGTEYTTCYGGDSCDLREVRVYLRAGEDEAEEEDQVTVDVEIAIQPEFRARCDGIAWSLDEDQGHDFDWYFVESNVSDIVTGTATGWHGVSNTFSVEKTCDSLTLRIIWFLQDSQDYQKRLLVRLLTESRNTGNALVVTTTGEKIPINKEVVLATGCSELSNGFCNTDYHTARMKIPEVSWDLNSTTAWRVIHALYVGADTAWRDAEPTCGDEHDAEQWLSIARFFQMYPVEGFLAKALVRVERCIAPSTYAVIMRDATVHDWTGVINKLEVCAKANAAGVLRNILSFQATSVTGGSGLGAKEKHKVPGAPLLASLKRKSEIAFHESHVVDVSPDGINISLDTITTAMSSTPARRLPTRDGPSWRLVLRRVGSGSKDIEVRVALDKLENAPRVFSCHLCDVTTTVFALDISDIKRETHRIDGKQTTLWLSPLARCEIDWSKAAIQSIHCVAHYANPVRVMRTHLYLNYPAALASADNVTERMLESARRGDGVDILFKSKGGGIAAATGVDIVTPFAHSALVREHSPVLKRLCDTASVRADLKASDTTPASLCREIVLDAKESALVILRDALYCNAKLWPELLSDMASQTNAALFDVAVLCTTLNPMGTSQALATLDTCTREIILSRMTGDSIDTMCRLARQHDKYAPLLGIIEAQMATDPACLTRLFRAKASGETTTIGVKRGATAVAAAPAVEAAAPASAAASGDNPAPLKKQCVPAAATGAAASLSLE